MLPSQAKCFEDHLNRFNNLGKHGSNELLKAKLETMPLDACNSSYILTNWTRHFAALRDGISPGQYCAFDPHNKSDSCIGDSGGPLQYFGDATSRIATVVGIVSFGIGGCGGMPAIYTRVAYHLDWIESIVWPTEGLI